MRFMPTYVHGIADYVMGAFLIVAPWIFGFSEVEAATWVMIILGAGVIVYSLFTDYELGVVRRLPMTVHLGLDLAGGLFLAVSPWLFGFSELVYLPHLILGILEMIASLTTKTVPGPRRVITAGKRTEVRDEYGHRGV